MLSNGGRDFLRAAQMLRSTNECPLEPLYFLICQSIELTLKAYVRGCGASKETLKSIGHDLEKVLSEAQGEKLSHFFTLVSRQEIALGMINIYYAGKDLQYTQVGSKSYPDLNILFGLAEELQSRTRKFCEDHRD